METVLVAIAISLVLSAAYFVGHKSDVSSLLNDLGSAIKMKKED